VRCGKRGSIHDGVVEAAVEALAAAPTARCHGDLLLRNVMVCGAAMTGEEPAGQHSDSPTCEAPIDLRGTQVMLVDWECAGWYLAGWDLALLWTQLGEEGRRVVEARAGGPAFLALVLFALCREAVFLEAFGVPAEHRGARRVQDEIAAIAKRLV
jgi:thiamine kinase-like enzyme